MASACCAWKRRNAEWRQIRHPVRRDEPGDFQLEIEANESDPVCRGVPVIASHVDEQECPPT
jgi:hypothetical protein